MAIISTTFSEKDINIYYLGNGLKLLVKQNPYNDIVAIDCFIDVGSYYETVENNGITNFVQKMLLKGTKKRSAFEISNALEEVGGIININTAEDYAEVYTITTSANIDIAITILSDILFNPTFPKEEVEKERNIILSEIKRNEDNSFQHCYKLFKKTLYGNSSYALPVEGDTKVIKQISRDDLIEYYKMYYVPNNMIITIVGNVNPSDIVTKIDEAFGYYEESQVQRPIPEIKTSSERKEVVVEKDVMQAMIIVGYPTVSIDNDDYARLKVLNAILGTGMSSRLFVALRDRKGLAYAVGSFSATRRASSHLAGYIGTKPESLEEAKIGLIEEINRLKRELVTEEELEKAKKSIIGRYLIDHQENKRQAYYLGWYELIGVGQNFDDLYIQKIKNVTRFDVNRVANIYLDSPTIAIIKPKEKK